MSLGHGAMEVCVEAGGKSIRRKRVASPPPEENIVRMNKLRKEITKVMGELTLEMTIVGMVCDTSLVIEKHTELKDLIGRLFEDLDKMTAQPVKKAKAGVAKVLTADSSTDTPIWWAYGEERSTPIQTNASLIETLPTGVHSVGETENGEGAWSTVVKKRNPKKAVQDIQPPMRASVKKTGEPTRVHKSRPIAVIVRRGEEPFPELLSTIKNKAKPENTGNCISKIRETRNGSLLIEINGGAEEAEKVKTEIERSLGPEASVRRVENRSVLELRDLDGTTTPEDILEAVSRESPGMEARVLGIWKTYGGGQAATIALAQETAKSLLVVGRIRVGLVYCRLRQGEERIRCYRCQAFGHEAKECRGPDRGKCCRRCGGTEHFAATCKATREEADAFRKTINNLEEKQCYVGSKSNECGTKEAQKDTPR